jgi:hypothetical protein
LQATVKYKPKSLSTIQRESSRAVTNWNLVAIACFAKSPRLAYKEAQDYGWGRKACLSVKSLAYIYFRFGQDTFLKTVEKFAPSIYDDLCLCECHHGLSEDDKFCDCCDTYGTRCFCYCHFCQYCDTESQNCFGDDCCGCNCHEDQDCCDDCQSACWCQCHRCLECDCDAPENDCEFSSDCNCDCHQSCDDCSGRHGEYDSYDNEDDADENCSCDCHDCDGCYDYCSDDCDCDCHECCDDCSDDADDYQNGDSSDYGGYYAPSDSSDLYSYQSKVERVSDQIKELTSVNFSIEETDQIDGDRIQAAAYPDGRVKITHELVNRMSEDELAFVVAHEVAHIEKEHSKKHQALLDAEITALKTGMLTVDQELKEKGAGFIKRTATQIIGGVVGGAGVVVTSRQVSQRHETEADERAIEIVKEAGFDEKASVTAYEKLHSGYVPEVGFVQSVISTHPAPRKRHQHLKNKCKD